MSLLTRAQAFHFGGQRGIALILAMSVMLVLLGVTGAIIPLAMTETAVIANHRRAAQGLYAAEAGFELVRSELGAITDWSDILRGRRTSTLWSSMNQVRLAGGALLDLGQLTDDLNGRLPRVANRETETTWRLFAHGSFDRLVQTPTQMGLLHVAVWVSDDPDEVDGDPETDSNGRLRVRAVAFGPSLARRVVGATVRRREDGAAELVSRLVDR